jgi:cytochrome c2
MSKFPKLVSGAIALIALASAPIADTALAGDAEAGKNVFKKCASCHAVGEDAKNKVGPILNDVFGRNAGTGDGFKYSKPMIAAGEGGLVWNNETMGAYLMDPKGYIKGNRMAFAGLKKQDDVDNVLAYLATFSAAAAQESSAPAAVEEKPAEEAAAKPAEAAPAEQSPVETQASAGAFRLGRLATDEEVAAWDIDIRPDGLGLPVGKGTVAQGEPLYAENCASCHGDFGEAINRWPVLAGGQDTLTDERPEKTIGSYWPYLSTVYDYVRRAMPFGNARAFSDDEIYALTAYLLYLNDVVSEEDFELSNENFSSVRLPNEPNFIEDGRNAEPHYVDKSEPCMSECKPGPVTVTMRARILDVTPDTQDDNEESQGGGID